MKCKACDATLSETDVVRKDRVTGEFLDLCTACYASSEAHRYECTTEVPIVAPEGSQEPLELYFDRFVARHKLTASWAEGLGLKMGPEERVEYFYSKCFNEFVRLVQEQDEPRQVAAERACGL